MKIALCGRFHSNKRYQGGSAEVFLALAKELAVNNEVTLFGRGEPVQDIINMCNKEGITLYFIPSDTYVNILLGPIRAFLLLKNRYNNFDIIHTHVGSYAIASLFFKKKSKIVTHVHQDLILKYNSVVDAVYLLLENLLLRIAASKSDLVVTVSSYMKNVLRNDWKLNNVIVIRNGIDINKFKYIKNINVKEMFGEVDTRLLFVGRLSQNKGIIELIKALYYLDDLNIKLLIIGDGNKYDEILKYQDIFKNKIKLIRNVKNSDLAKYYSAASFVVVPSYYESFGLVPRESLACGTPVIIADNTGLKEIDTEYRIKRVDSKIIAESIRVAVHSKPKSRSFYAQYVKNNYSWDLLTNDLIIEYKKIL